MHKKALLVSLCAGLAALLLFSAYRRRYEAEVSGGPKVDVLIAAQDVPLGAVLSKAALGIRGVPRAYVERRHIPARDLDKVVGTPVSLALRAGEIVLWTDLATARTEGRGLSALVQDGMRAISVPAESLDGLLRPGDRVDVLFTASAELGSGDRPTVTLLQNLMVLAVGGRTEPEEPESPRGRGGVTLSVTVEHAAVLTQAKHRGSLALVLRHPDDIVVADPGRQVSAADVLEPAQRAQWLERSSPAPRRLDHVQ